MQEGKAQENQWRRQHFFGGGTLRPLKGYHTPPQGGREGGEAAHLTAAKFHFLKRCKVLEKESIFQKYQHFACQKSIFSKKNFEN